MITGIILAAGESKRMGTPKPLLDYRGKTFLDHAIDMLKAAGLAEIIVVLGAQADQIRKQAVLNNAQVVLNLEYQKGQLSSLQKGLERVSEQAAGILVTLVDHPLVKLTTYQGLIAKFNENEGHIILPNYLGKHGHPLIIPRLYFNEIMQAPLDIGLRYVISKQRAEIIDLPVDDIGIVRNINLMEQYLNSISVQEDEV
ncbi:nucleotidyltransferase family protein [bacterium]|nr:nucleotidyltransferase family protein [bacterium]